jgi:CelD/BcsL family acetyltransferase involved in cellulose biosynthesis
MLDSVLALGGVSVAIQLKKISNIEEFAGLKAIWDAIGASEIHTVFLTHDWLIEWWRFLGSGFRLWTLVAYDGNQVVGIMPLMWRSGRDGFRRLTFMGTGEVTPNHLDLIALPGRRGEVLEALCMHLAESAGEWDVLELDKLPIDSPTLEELRTGLEDQGLTVSIEKIADCPFAELPQDFASYIQGRSASTRTHYRRQLRRLICDYPDTRFGLVESADELKESMRTLVRLHQARWIRKGYGGAFANPRVLAFHYAVSERARQSGILRFHYLKVGDVLVAATYGFRVGDCEQGYITSFDGTFYNYGPGILNRGHAIEQLIAQGGHRWDFLEGAEEYKSHWSTGNRVQMRFRVFAPHLRGRAAEAVTKMAEVLLRLSVRIVPIAIRRPAWNRLQGSLHRWRGTATEK